MTNTKRAREDEGVVIEIDDSAAAGPRTGGFAGRRPYDSPRLIEWGSLADLTRGPFSGLDDLPLDGGTTPE